MKNYLLISILALSTLAAGAAGIYFDTNQFNYNGAGQLKLSGQLPFVTLANGSNNVPTNVFIVYIDSTAGPSTNYLTLSTNMPGKVYWFKKTSSDVNQVLICTRYNSTTSAWDGYGSGQTNWNLSLPMESVMLHANGVTNWFRF